MNVRGIDSVILRALVLQANQRVTDQATAGTKFHYFQSATDSQTDPMFPATTRLSVSLANATDATTALALTNQIKTVLVSHMADGPFPGGAHKAVDSTNVVSTATATDTTTAITLANAEKANYNAHLTQSGVHLNNDGSNSVATADATNSTTLITLVNAFKTAVNAHMLSGGDGFGINAVQPG